MGKKTRKTTLSNCMEPTRVADPARHVCGREDRQGDLQWYAMLHVDRGHGVERDEPEHGAADEDHASAPGHITAAPDHGGARHAEDEQRDVPGDVERDLPSSIFRADVRGEPHERPGLANDERGGRGWMLAHEGSHGVEEDLHLLDFRPAFDPSPESGDGAVVHAV